MEALSSRFQSHLAPVYLGADGQGACALEMMRHGLASALCQLCSVVFRIMRMRAARVNDQDVRGGKREINMGDSNQVYTCFVYSKSYYSSYSRMINVPESFLEVFPSCSPFVLLFNHDSISS